MAVAGHCRGLERSEGRHVDFGSDSTFGAPEASRRGLLGSGGELSIACVVAIADTETETYSAEGAAMNAHAVFQVVASLVIVAALWWMEVQP